eukprot:11041442-Lingulodinium_polyedra.AAC.1
MRPSGARQNRPRPAPRLGDREGAPSAPSPGTPTVPPHSSSGAPPALGLQPGPPSPPQAGPGPCAAAGASA